LQHQNGAEPFPHGFIVDPHVVENFEHLSVEIGFGNSDSRMPGSPVMRAVVVGIEAIATLRFLGLEFAGNLVVAVPTFHQSASVSQRMGLIVTDVEKCLHAIPGWAINNGLLLTRIPSIAIPDLANVGTVIQDVMHRCTIETRNGRAVNRTLLV
jgi:hypothetical protein